MAHWWHTFDRGIRIGRHDTTMLALVFLFMVSPNFSEHCHVENSNVTHWWIETRCLVFLLEHCMIQYSDSFLGIPSHTSHASDSMNATHKYERYVRARYT